MPNFCNAPRGALATMARRLVGGLSAAVLSLSLSPAMAQSLVSAWGYGYAPTSGAAYNIAYAEAERGLTLNCVGNVSNEYVINSSVYPSGWTWVATVTLGASCT
jgi:hypothetical protein